ncbi:MAG: TolC family protein [Xanthomonadales bacterium]|nr:TolC family protein [Xanthomonadales bacterium]
MPCTLARHFAILLGAAAVGACATRPLPVLAPSVPAQWQQAIQADAGKVDLRGWWHAFHDPQLDALVDTALRDNLDVAAAREHLLAARALERSSRYVYFPGLRAKTMDAIDPDARATYFVAGFDALWEIPLFGRDVATARQAQGNHDLALANLQQARVSLVAEVVRNWLDLRAAQQRQVTLDAMRGERERQLQLWQTRLRLKLADPGDVAQAEAAAAQARAAAAEPAQAMRAAAQALAALLGRDEADPAWLAPGALPDLGALALRSAPADLLRTRPEIVHAEAAVLAAAGDAGVAHADMFPSVKLGGSIVWATNMATYRRPGDSAIASAGPVLDIPLFDWGLRRAQDHAKAHELQAAVFAYRQAVLDGVAEVQTALGRLALQRQQEHESAQAAAALERAHAAVARRVTLGLDSPLQQLDSALAAGQARLTAIDARTAHSLAFVSLYKALGGAPLPAVSDDAQAAVGPRN